MDKKSDLWETPQWLIDQLKGEFGDKFADLAANQNNCKGCVFYENIFGEEAELYVIHAKWLFLNPPYSKPDRFILRAIELSTRERLTLVMLLKADMNTRRMKLWWDFKNHKCNPGFELRFFDKRVQFTHPNKEYMEKCGGSNFAVMLVIYRPGEIK